MCVVITENHSWHFNCTAWVIGFPGFVRGWGIHRSELTERIRTLLDFPFWVPSNVPMLSSHIFFFFPALPSLPLIFLWILKLYGPSTVLCNASCQIIYFHSASWTVWLEGKERAQIDNRRSPVCCSTWFADSLTDWTISSTAAIKPRCLSYWHLNPYFLPRIWSSKIWVKDILKRFKPLAVRKHIS